MKKSNKFYTRRKSIRGYAFISLWLAGTLLWFIIPVISSLEISFRNTDTDNRNMMGEWCGIDNYMYAFTSDPYFYEKFIDSISETAVSVPLIVIFSLAVAVILNHKFRFRNFFTAMFFLPVIIASGAVYNIILSDISRTGINQSGQFSDMLDMNITQKFLETLGIYGSDNSFFIIVQNISEKAVNIIWDSGIQIFIFTAILQTIPQSARETACIEGATSWEYFWKVTVPYISPAITANFIFTAVNTFTYQNNEVIKRILEMQSEWNFGKASAMAWSYFLTVLIFTSVFIFIFRKVMKWE